jgi:hypothetical protein
MLLDVENIQFVGKNRKYTIARGKKCLILSPEMRVFKQILQIACRPASIAPPQRLYIELTCYHDIDAVIESVIDAVKEKAFANHDDADIEEVHILRIKGKKGKPGRIRAWAEPIEKEAV